MEKDGLCYVLYKTLEKFNIKYKLVAETYNNVLLCQVN